MKWVAAILLLGCANVEQGTSENPRLDREAFAAKVQPILIESCANPTCHGRPERGLSIYAPKRFRADPSRTHLDEPLTDEELEHNFCAASALVNGDDVDASLLLRKAIGEHSGSYHGGGVVLDGVDDRRYRTLRAWAAGSR